MATHIMPARPLNQMTEGEMGIVVANACQSSQTARLAELGLAEGEPVRILRSGSPMVLQIGTCRLCVRAEEAHHVAVLCL